MANSVVTHQSSTHPTWRYRPWRTNIPGPNVSLAERLSASKTRLRSLRNNYKLAQKITETARARYEAELRRFHHLDALKAEQDGRLRVITTKMTAAACRAKHQALRNLDKILHGLSDSQKAAVIAQLKATVAQSQEETE